jgi:hypothetical protein
MNERIRELYNRCFVLLEHDTPNVGFDFEKFAELIVRECLNQCYNRGMNDELYAGQLKAASYIEEHFGVK